MNRCAFSGISLGAIALCIGATTDENRREAEAPAKTQAVFSKLVDACKAPDWRAESAARQELTKLGWEALPLIRGGAKEHGSPRVRRACYEILNETFPKDEATAEIVRASGLRDPDPQIRYISAFWLGDMRVSAAKEPLLAILNDQKADANLRYTAAKSLAQLGEAISLPTLRRAVSSDRYMDRYIGNLGLKAIAGKDINDFEGYRFEEGSYVSGGQEMIVLGDPITDAERSAKRFSAIAAYFKWLKQERPELYAEFDFARKIREREGRAAQLKKAAEGK